MNEPITDAEIVPEPEPPISEPSTQMIRYRRNEVVRPLDAAELIESFHSYQKLLPQLLTDDDYQSDGKDRFVKKSGWRKIATAFDLDVQLIRSDVERDEDGQPLRAEVWARAIAPSGRSMDGDGYCCVTERRFSSPRGRQKLENDLRATATTRAMNRAISGLVGMGAVSAEEIDDGTASRPRPEPLTPMAGTPEIDRARRALAYLYKSGVNTLAIREILDDLGPNGAIPAIAIRAIGLTAKYFKLTREEQKLPWAEVSNE